MIFCVSKDDGYLEDTSIKFSIVEKDGNLSKFKRIPSRLLFSESLGSLEFLVAFELSGVVVIF